MDSKKLQVSVTEDEELDPYHGFFTVHRSADFMLKICFTLLSFVLILLLTSFHITRKKYRLPSVFRSSKIRRLSEIFKIDSINPQLPAIRDGETLAVSCPTGLLLLHRMALHDVKLPIHCYSCIPGWLRFESYGLLLANASAERRILARLVDYAFHDLPLMDIETAIRVEFEALLTENLNILDNFYFDGVARRCTMRLIMNAQISDAPSDLAKVREISRILDDLKRLHYGSMSLSTWDRFSSLFGILNPARNALGDIKRIMETPIREEMNIVHMNLIQPGISNFLRTFITARMELEDEGDQTGFLTVAHLAHAATDCQLLVEEVLIPAYRWTLLILGHRPLLAEELREELKSNGGRTGPCAHAFALELVRWTLIGSQLSSMQLIDDWRMSHVDYPTDSILLYDLRSAVNEPQLWTDPDMFLPERFQRKGTEKVNPNVKALESLLEASSWGLFVPPHYLIHMIATGAAQMSSLLRIKVEGNSDFQLASHSICRMPAPFSFQLRER